MFHYMNTAQFIYKWTSVLVPVFAITNNIAKKILYMPPGAQAQASLGYSPRNSCVS